MPSRSQSLSRRRRPGVTASTRRALGAFVLALLAVVAAVAPAPLAVGQTTPSSVAEGAGASAPAATTAPGPASGSAPTQVRLRVVQVGLRDRARPGDWTGFLVEYVDSAPTARDLQLAVELADPDGDAVRFVAPAATTPGRPGRAWVYARLPGSLQPGSPIRVTASLPPPDGAPSVARAGLLGATTVALSEPGGRPPSILPRGVAALAVVGTAGGSGGVGGGAGGGLGLQPYTQQLTRVQAWLPTGHELTELLQPLRVADLPDDWKGYGRLSELVWTSDGGGASSPGGGASAPGQMTDAQAAALRHWVARGGHLVVLLGGGPGAGPGAWGGWADRRLAPLMPRVEPRREEGVSAGPFLPVLTRATRPELAAERIDVTVLPPAAGASPSEAAVLVRSTEGLPVVARRHYGAGTVTVCGLDFSSGRLGAMGVVDAGVFWHRVLGRRAEVVDAQSLRDQSLLGGSVLVGTRREEFIDSGVPAEVNRTGRAAAGVLVALGVFVAYWLLAGPVAYSVLKRRGLARHSWTAFVAVSVVFAIGTWGVALWLRPRDADARHLTFLDAVAGGEVVSARGWSSVLLPGYGAPRVEVPTAALAPGANAMAGFDDGAATDALAFTDARAYTIDARRADRADLPARSTVKTLQIDWAGPLADPARWRLPGPAGAGESVPAVGWPSGRGVGAPWTLSGRLVHGLHAPLTEVTVIVVARPMPLDDGRATDGALLAEGVAFAVPEWPAGQVLDLSSFDLVAARRSGARLENWLSGLANTGVISGFAALAPRRSERLTMARAAAASVFPLLEPPQWRLTNGGVLPVVRREFTQGMDVARWFTQPCVIVLGELAGPSPVPMTLDGRPVASDGRTIVRWVYPLADAPR